MKLLRAILRLLGALVRPLFSAALEDLDDGRQRRLGATHVATTLGTFQDRARSRTIPYKLYYPDDGVGADGPHPVVIFSHGLGGSREAAPYLGEALAQNGYYAVFIQHAGSDETLLEGARSGDEIRARLRGATTNPSVAVDRFRDLPAAISGLEEMNRSERFGGQLDLARIGMAGHSFGARGVMMAAGQRMGPMGAPFKDPRVRAGIAFSPNLPPQMMPGQRPAAAFDTVDIPLFHITGTKDGMPVGEDGAGGGGRGFDPQTRTLPFRYIRAAHQYLLVLKDAHHNTFSSRLRNIEDIDPDEMESPTVGGPEELRHVQTLGMAVVMFFDAYLKRDESAQKMLKGGFAQTLSPGDRFEFK